MAKVTANRISRTMQPDGLSIFIETEFTNGTWKRTIPFKCYPSELAIARAEKNQLDVYQAAEDFDAVLGPVDFSILDPKPPVTPTPTQDDLDRQTFQAAMKDWITKEHLFNGGFIKQADSDAAQAVVNGLLKVQLSGPLATEYQDLYTQLLKQFG